MSISIINVRLTCSAAVEHVKLKWLKPVILMLPKTVFKSLNMLRDELCCIKFKHCTLISLYLFSCQVSIQINMSEAMHDASNTNAIA
jgi:hypothetical protein